MRRSGGERWTRSVRFAEGLAPQRRLQPGQEGTGCHAEPDILPAMNGRGSARLHDAALRLVPASTGAQRPPSTGSNAVSRRRLRMTFAAFVSAWSVWPQATQDGTSSAAPFKNTAAGPAVSARGSSRTTGRKRELASQPWS